MAATDATPIPIKNQAYRVYFPILDNDGDLVAGAAGLDSERSLDGATFADCTNEATEVATSSGIYYLDLTASEMNTSCTAIKIKSTTTDSKDTVIILYPQEAGDIPVDVETWLGTACATPTTAGVPEVDITHIGGSTQSATDLKDFADAGYDPATNKVEGVKLADTLTTYTGNTPQTGDTFAALPTNFADLAITVTTGQVTVGTNNDKTGYSISGSKTTLDALNDITTAQVNTEVDTALTDIGLDHLLSASVTGTDVADGSVIASIVSKSVTPDWDSFVNTTDALEALADAGGGDATAANQTTIINHLTDVKGTGFVKDTHSLTDIEAYVDLIDDGTSGLAKIATDANGIKAVTDNLPDSGALTSIAQADTMEGFFQVTLRSDAAITTDRAAILTLINANEGTGVGDYAATTESQEALRDHIGDGTNLTEAGGTGDHLTALATAAALSTAQTDLDTITGSDGVTLATTQGNYAPSTATALATAQADLDIITGTDGVTLATSQANYAPATAAAMAAAQTDLDTITDTGVTCVALTTAAITDVWATDTLTEAYAADGAAATPAELMYMIFSVVAQADASGTTLTTRKLDGTTASMTFTLDDATTPTSRVRAS